MKNSLNKILSVVVILALAISFISNDRESVSYIVLATLLNLSYLFYYKSSTSYRSMILDLAIFFYMIADILLFLSTSGNVFFQIGVLLMSLETILFTYLIFGCSEKIKTQYYFIGPILLLPYFMIMFSHVSESLESLTWLILLEIIVTLILATFSFAHFAKSPTLIDSFALLGAIFLALNELLSGYNFFYYQQRYFTYELTVTSILYHLFILTFLINKLGHKEVLFYRNNKDL